MHLAQVIIIYIIKLLSPIFFQTFHIMSKELILVINIFIVIQVYKVIKSGLRIIKKAYYKKQF